MKNRKKITIIISTIIVICIITAVVALKIFNKRIIREMPFCHFYATYSSDMTDDQIERIFQNEAQYLLASGACEDISMNSKHIVRFEFTQEQLDKIISQGKKLLENGTFLPIDLNQSISNDYKKLEIYLDKQSYEDKTSETYNVIYMKTSSMLDIQMFEGISNYKEAEVTVEYHLSDTNEIITETYTCYDR